MKRSGRGQERMTPRRQTNWDARAAANFICGGAGGGLLVATALAAPWIGEPRALVVVALALVGTGLTSVWFEIGRPLRALNVYRNVATSWMTREAVIALGLFSAGALAVVYESRAALGLAGVFGLAFVFAQGRILRNQTGIPAWRHTVCAGLIIATGLAEGAGLLGAAALVWPALVPVGLFIAVLAGVRLVVWRRYLATLHGVGAPAGTLRVFDEIDGRFVWLGHALPAALGLAAAGLGSPVLAALAGVVLAATGGWFKYVLICRAALTQGFALPRTPARGSGRPGAGTRPGWIRAKVF